MIKIIKNTNVQEGVFFIILSGFIIRESLNYHKYGSWALSPALIPVGISIIMIILSIFLIISGINKEMVPDERTFIQRWKNPFLVLTATILYLVLLPILHFIIATFLFLVSILFILGERKILIIASISIITPLFIYGLFDILLSVRLP